MTADKHPQVPPSEGTPEVNHDHSPQSWGDFLLDQQDLWEPDSMSSAENPSVADEHQATDRLFTEFTDPQHRQESSQPRLANILATADPLLDVSAPLLRALSEMPQKIDDLREVEWLKELLKREITRFTLLCDEINVPWKKMAIVRYCLCTALDEAAHSKAWGIAAGWSQSNLLNYFENDNDGGNKFFLLIGRISMSPAGYSDVLGILLRILGLGFEGRYSILPDGERQLLNIRQRLLALAENQQKLQSLPMIMGEMPEIQPSVRQRFSVSWPNSLIVAVLLISVAWLTGKALLFTETQPVVSGIYALQNLRYPMPVFTGRLRLAELLQAEISRNLLSVDETPQQSHVVLQGDTSFRSGSVVLSPETKKLLIKIAQQIHRVNGEVLVVGHTDALPVRHSAYTDNQRLSVQRADVVAELFIHQGIAAEKITARGMADQQPVSSNTTASGRAKNRRVEIFVTYQVR